MTTRKLPWINLAALAAVAVAAVLIVVINTVTIALCGPWDPWETHYGEVARQIIVRDDPLDLWWRPGYGPDGNAENTFWSKPALPFWLMALSMAIFGVGSRPAADELVRSPWPELALRLPSLLAGLLCAAFLGYVVWRLLREEAPTSERGPSAAARAGIFTAVVLSTMPQWALVARQALTDMFFVAPVVVAMGAWALAWSQPDRLLRRRTIGELLRRPAAEAGGGYGEDSLSGLWKRSPGLAVALASSSGEAATGALAMASRTNQKLRRWHYFADA